MRPLFAMEIFDYCILLKIYGVKHHLAVDLLDLAKLTANFKIGSSYPDKFSIQCFCLTLTYRVGGIWPPKVFLFLFFLP